MSDRDLNSDMIAELAEPKKFPVYLLELGFDSGTLYMTDADQDIEYPSPWMRHQDGSIMKMQSGEFMRDQSSVGSGNVYLRTGGFLTFQGLQETGELLVNQVTATLSGVDTAAAMQKVLNDDFLDRPMTIRFGLRNSFFQLIDDPIIIFQGRMDGPTINEDPDSGSSTVSVRGTPAFADFGRKPGRHTNHEEQTFYFPGDKGLEFVSEIPKVISWGRN